MSRSCSKPFPKCSKAAGSSRAVVGRTSWSFADQGVVSLGNFLTQIVLVRYLPPSEYGVFVLLYSVMILLNTCQTSLVTYPLSFHGAASDDVGLRKLAAFSLLLTAAIALPQIPIVFGVAVFLKHAGLTLAIVAGLLCWQLQETLRRALMAHLRHRAAFPGDALSYCGQAAVLWSLAMRGSLGLPAVFWVIAATSVIAAALQAAQLRPAPSPLRDAPDLLRSYWRLGKWNLPTYATDAATSGSFPWILGLAQGPAQAASFQAVSNLLRVSHPVMFGVGNLVTPAASRARKEGGIRQAVRSGLRPGVFGGLLLLPYFGALLIWPRLALSLAYGHSSAYVGMTAPLRWFVLAYVFSYVFSVIGAFLNGIGHPSTLFIGEVAGAVCALAAGIPLTVRYGVAGACLGFFLVTLSRTVTGCILGRRLVRSEPGMIPPLPPGMER